jgi:hypothetical protein
MNIKKGVQNNTGSDVNNDINMTMVDGGIKSFDNTRDR